MCAYLVKQFILGLDFFAVLSTNVSWSFSSWYHLWLLIMHQKSRQVHKMHPIAETVSLLPQHLYCNFCFHTYNNICSFMFLSSRKSHFIILFKMCACMLSPTPPSHPALPSMHTYEHTHTHCNHFRVKTTCFAS